MNHVRKREGRPAAGALDEAEGLYLQICASARRSARQKNATAVWESLNELMAQGITTFSYATICESCAKKGSTLSVQSIRNHGGRCYRELIAAFETAVRPVRAERQEAAFRHLLEKCPDLDLRLRISVLIEERDRYRRDCDALRFILKRTRAQSSEPSTLAVQKPAMRSRSLLALANFIDPRHLMELGWTVQSSGAIADGLNEPLTDPGFVECVTDVLERLK
ncbi:hypothetical protein ACVWWQ_002454 [Rhodanobacter sp. TND4EL1]